MAQNSFRNVLQVLGSISCLLLLVHKAGAFEFKVGGDGLWKVPSTSNNDSNPYIQWAVNHRFQVNDTIVFKYQGKKDSVLLVSNKEDYNKCNTSRPIESHEGNEGQQTTVTLGHSGPFYFISGFHCDQNEKLVVVVMADRRHKNLAAPPPQSKNPKTPAPAPAGEGSPPPPPSGPSPSVEITPTPAPSSLDTPGSKSGGFQMVSGLVSSIGVTLVGSLLLLF